MYDLILVIHNLLRWVVLVLAVVVVVLAWIGWLGKREWQERDRKVGTFYTIAMDVQLLLGVILYFFLSPFALSAIMNQGMEFVMGNRDFRVFAMEHLVFMLIAVVLAHLGSILSKKAPDSAGKYRRAAIFYTISLVVLLVGIPWWRPLLRF